MDPTPEETLAAITAGFDQMRAAAKDLASTLVEFRQGLLDGGYTADVAEQMAVAYFGMLLTAAMRNA